MAPPPADEPEGDDLAALATQTLAVYRRNARRYDTERSRSLRERAWLERWLALVPPAGHLLDLGCGGGEPIARHLLTDGYRVTGLDATEDLLALARERLPAGRWILGDMRDLDLDQRFDGIVAWDSFFHLTAADQRALLPRLAAHLAPGGALLLTVGPAAGEVVGRVGADRVYHASLAPAEYREQLQRLGLHPVHFQPEDPDCGGHSVLIAQAFTA